MISSELKMMVAENCSCYESRVVTMASIGGLSESCSNCSNYIRGVCLRGLFKDISDVILIN